MNGHCFIDLFAGAGGLSEGFINEGFKPIAHVEMNKNASDTLKTRTAFHYLNKKNNLSQYFKYLKNEISREELWNSIPQHLLLSIINVEINSKTIDNIFNHIDVLLDGKKADILVGGPPCQAYSLVGRSRDPKRMKGDKRNYLFKYYAEFLRKYKPKYFVFENVLGLLSAGYSQYLQTMQNLFSEIGYYTDYEILNAAEYGVLQNRKRVIIIGRKGKAKFDFPVIEKLNNSWEIKKDLLYDLPFLEAGQSNEIANYQKPINNYFNATSIRNGVNFTTQHISRPHNDRDLEIYSIAINKWLNERARLKYNELPKRLLTHIKKDIFLDRFKVIDPTGYSHTVMAHISKDGHYYIYPDINQVRSISVREAARIQSFPDNYYFEGGRTAAFNQIGNAVPPLMAQAIAKAIKNYY
jgi:DNA (cytosine-5)-methyltransferase 1